MLTNNQIEGIRRALREEVERLGKGGAATLAKRFGVSQAVISQICSGTYPAKSDDMYKKIGLELDYEFGEERCEVAPITNYREVEQVLIDARNTRRVIAIAANAGSGKTIAARDFCKRHKGGHVYMLTCREWSARAFLLKLIDAFNISMPKGYANASELIDLVEGHIKPMAAYKPLLIIDQANSLRDSALRAIIHIENACGPALAMVLLGTENLEYKIKRGVMYKKDGSDELDSRLGRNYAPLTGATLLDVRAICEANGVSNKTMQEAIFKEASPVQQTFEDGSRMRAIRVIKDLRRVQRIIDRELLLMAEGE